VLIYFPFTDLSSRKLRPALVLHGSGQDVVVAFISSRLERYDPETDVLVTRGHPKYAMTGLKVGSVTGLTKIATLHRKLIAGELGEAGPSAGAGGRREDNEGASAIAFSWRQKKYRAAEDVIAVFQDKTFVTSGIALERSLLRCSLRVL